VSFTAGSGQAKFRLFIRQVAAKLDHSEIVCGAIYWWEHVSLGGWHNTCIKSSTVFLQYRIISYRISRIAFSWQGRERTAGFGGCPGSRIHKLFYKQFNTIGRSWCPCILIKIFLIYLGYRMKLSKIILLLLSCKQHSRAAAGCGTTVTIGTYVQRRQSVWSCRPCTGGDYNPISSSQTSYIAKSAKADLLLLDGGQLEFGMAAQLLSSNNGSCKPGNGISRTFHAWCIWSMCDDVSRELGDVHPEGNPHFFIILIIFGRRKAITEDERTRSW